LPTIDVKSILSAESTPKPEEDDAWQVETKRCAKVLQFQANFELGMAKEYERKQQDSVLYGLSKATNKISVMALPSFQTQIAAKTSLFGGVKAYTNWKKKAWKMYMETAAEVPVDSTAEVPVDSSKATTPAGPTLLPAGPTPLQFGQMGSRSSSCSPKAGYRTLKEPPKVCSVDKACEKEEPACTQEQPVFASIQERPVVSIAET
jgi:hypothetical protein